MISIFNRVSVQLQLCRWFWFTFQSYRSNFSLWILFYFSVISVKILFQFYFSIWSEFFVTFQPFQSDWSLKWILFDFLIISVQFSSLKWTLFHFPIVLNQIFNIFFKAWSSILKQTSFLNFNNRIKETGTNRLEVITGCNVISFNTCRVGFEFESWKI